jgi:uncharacterized protein YggE
MRRSLPILLAAVAILAAAALSGVARPEAASGETTSQPRTVTTLGRGTVTTVPDVATINAAVQTKAKTAAAAIADNARRMERVIAALKAAGGETLQTQQVAVYPTTDKNEGITGYVARNGVSATIAIAKAGGLIDAAVKAGANAVEGPMLSRSDSDAIYREALQNAVADARLKAEALAKGGAFGVGQVVAVVEQGASEPDVEFAAASPAVGKDAAPTPIEPGNQTIEAGASVTFAIT